MSISPDAFPPEEAANDESAVPATEQPAEEATTEQQPSSSSSETMLPPEAQGEVNGGPLGCCLGVVVGLLLTLLLTTVGSLLLSNGAFLGPATFPVALAGAALCGYLGWKIGKFIYREYELSPRQQRRLEQLELHHKQKMEQQERKRRR